MKNTKEEIMENTNEEIATRENVVRLLKASHPEAEIASDEEMYAAIIDDYFEYAKLIEAEEARGKAEEEKKAKKECMIESLRNNSSLREGEIDTVLAALESIAENWGQGKLSDEDLQQVVRGLRYEADVAQAEINGRNAKIEESVYAENLTDGVPHLCGGETFRPVNPVSLFAIAKNA